MFLVIAVVVEVVEHDPKEECVCHQRVREEGLVAAVHEKGETGVHQSHHELCLFVAKLLTDNTGYQRSSKTLTIWTMVRYFFHQRKGRTLGPRAERA